MDAEKPDYDLDEEDIKYVKDVLKGQKKFEIDETTFEEMIDRLEKNSGHSVITSKEAKLLLKEDDDLILAVYDYWVEKRLRIKQPLLPSVKSDKRDIAQNQPSTPSLNSSGVFIHCHLQSFQIDLKCLVYFNFSIIAILARQFKV